MTCQFCRAKSAVSQTHSAEGLVYNEGGPCEMCASRCERIYTVPDDGLF